MIGPHWAGESAGHEGEIGRVTAQGWVPYPALPESTWTLDHPPAGTEKLPEPQWSVDVNAKGEVWQGRCDWGHFGEGGDFTNVVYARISPAAGRDRLAVADADRRRDRTRAEAAARRRVDRGDACVGQLSTARQRRGPAQAVQDHPLHARRP